MNSDDFSSSRSEALNIFYFFTHSLLTQKHMQDEYELIPDTDVHLVFSVDRKRCAEITETDLSL